MGNILEYTMMNKLNDDLNRSINIVGGDTSSVNDIFDYPKVILEQLSTAYNIKAGPGITIEEIPAESKKCCNCCHNHNGHCDINKNCNCCDCCDCCNNKKPTLLISANSGALLINDIKLNDGTVIGTKQQSTIQEVFEELFDKVIPGISVLTSGSVIKTTENGIDISDSENLIGGLDPDTFYIKLIFAAETEPIYIKVQELVNNSHNYTDTKIAEAVKDAMYYRGESVTDPKSLDGPVVKGYNKPFKVGDVVSFDSVEYLKIQETGNNQIDWDVLGGAGGGSAEVLTFENYTAALNWTKTAQNSNLGKIIYILNQQELEGKIYTKGSYIVNSVGENPSLCVIENSPAGESNYMTKVEAKQEITEVATTVVREETAPMSQDTIDDAIADKKESEVNP